MSEIGLPRWERVPLDEVCEIIRGLAFPTTDKTFAPSEGTIACLRTTNVQRSVGRPLVHSEKACAPRLSAGYYRRYSHFYCQ